MNTHKYTYIRNIYIHFYSVSYHDIFCPQGEKTSPSSRLDPQASTNIGMEDEAQMASAWLATEKCVVFFPFT